MTAVARSRRDLAPSWPVVGLVAVMIGLVLVGSIHVGDEPGDRAIDALALACGIAGALSVLLWRVSALTMVVIAAAGMFVYTALDYPGGPALLPGPIVLVFLGFSAPRRIAWTGAALVIIAVTAGRWLSGQTFGPGELLVVGWALAAVLGGQAIRAAADRRSAERDREVQLRRQALVDERLRIAQDLHDSVAHAMATINVQSGVAAHLIDRRPEQAREALEAIRSASSDVLDELGAIVGVLRDPGDQAPLTPASRLADVEALVARARTDGLAVTYDCSITGTVANPIGVAAYRVVQEALTNTRRHAGDQATAEVMVAAEPGRLVVRVDDDGGRSSASGTGGSGGHDPAAATASRAVGADNGVGVGPDTGSRAGTSVDDDRRAGDGGFGLVGMRERVEATGGTLRTGPTTTGGFAVRAEWVVPT